MIDGAWPAHPTSPFLDRVVAPRVARCRSKGGRKARVAELLQEHARLLYELHARSLLFVFRSSVSGFPPRKRCERVCDRAYFSHTGGSRPPLAKIEDHSMQRGHRWWRGTWYRLTVYDNTVYHSTRLLTLSCLDTRRAVCVTVWIRLDATHPAAVNPHLSPALQASFDE